MQSSQQAGMPPRPPQQTPQTPVSVEFELMEFVNDTPREVPLDIRRQNWGFVTRLLGLTMLAENEANAQIYRIHEQALFIQSSVPARLITDSFINWIRQFEELCVLKVYQSKLRPRGWINERTIGAYTVQETVMAGQRQGQARRKILPWGPL